MSEASTVVKLTTDQTWPRMRVEAATAAASEPGLASFLHATVLNHETFEAALSYRLAQKLSDREVNSMVWREVCLEAYADEPSIVESALADILAVFDRDPASNEYIQPVFVFQRLSLSAGPSRFQLAVAP